MADGKRKWGLWTWVLIGGEVLLVLLVLNWFLTQDRDGGKPAPAPAPAAPEQADRAAGAPKTVPPREAPLAADAKRTQRAAQDDPAPPDFDLVRVDPEGGAVVAGRAVAGSSVVLMVEGREVARAEAGPDGAFALFADLPPDMQPRRLSLRMDLADGRKIAAAGTVILAPAAAPEPARAEVAAPPAETVSLAAPGPDREGRAGTVASAPDATDPAAPGPDPAVVAERAVATATPGGEAAPAIPAPRAPAVLLSDAGGVRVLQPPEGDLPPGAAGVLIEAISYDAGGAVILAGRGAAGGALRLYLDNAAIAEGRIDEAGRWRRRLDGVDPGVYTLRADLLNPDGTVAARFETPFQREPAETILAAAPAPGPDPDGAAARVITVQPGFTLWGIADRTYGSGFQYVKIFRANRDQIRDPDLIYPGQVFDLPAGD
ncbi:LysM peptidoglycan-binding domain-containing protein [Rhodovulum marinum]|uniref:LysM domain-containing protein n=1 Tax=Rhodovulum marinum TaxID=320662 RepID=A0A4V2SRF8_9RHOB|nr:LysM peptidoglycan-binding domain-containing protein [Rhodovulum marinum]TCP42396.1 LysM domain-containing protein [Rhodovulum marinum]